MKITFKSVVQGFEHAIDTVTASSLLIHAIMIGAAIASYGNIESYLSAGHTNELTSMALAAVLGVSLVVAASRLTKLNLARLRTDKSLQTVVVIALATGIISGLLQALEYAKTYEGATPYLLGFGIPLLLEVAPAMTVALVKSIDANERTNTLRRDMADKITESIAAALDCISPDDMRKEVEQAAQLFTREFVDNVAGEMIYELRNSNQHKLSNLLQDAQLQDTKHVQADATPIAQGNTYDTAPLLAERVEQLRGEGLQDVDIAVQLRAESYSGNSIAKELGVNPSTVSRWLKGTINAVALPTIAPVHTNGYHKAQEA
jgi:transcriptional regulator with XRE-family HTH domain